MTRDEIGDVFQAATDLQAAGVAVEDVSNESTESETSTLADSPPSDEDGQLEAVSTTAIDMEAQSPNLEPAVALETHEVSSQTPVLSHREDSEVHSGLEAPVTKPAADEAQGDSPPRTSAAASEEIAALQPTAVPDLTAIPANDRSAIESVCRPERTIYGPTAYNDCLREQLKTYNAAPPAPDLTAIPANDRSAIESVCRPERTIYGPTAYNDCLREQLAAYSRAQ